MNLKQTAIKIYSGKSTKLVAANYELVQFIFEHVLNQFSKHIRAATLAYTQFF